MAGIFISYRRGDSEGQARALSIELTNYVGDGSVFMDVDSIALGRDFRQSLHESLEIVRGAAGAHRPELARRQGRRRKAAVERSRRLRASGNCDGAQTKHSCHAGAAAGGGDAGPGELAGRPERPCLPEQLRTEPYAMAVRRPGTRAAAWARGRASPRRAGKDAANRDQAAVFRSGGGRGPRAGGAQRCAQRQRQRR